MKGEKNNIIVGLDIGTTKICAIVGQLAENGKINILGIGKSSSQGGVSRGMVANVSKVVQAIQEVDSVLLLGHGHGESDMRHVLLKHLTTHYPELIERIVDQTSVESHSLTEPELIAISFAHFGRQPLRHLPLSH